ncbi:MAG TPA: hypothetical protein VNX61_07650, partial [Rhizomicrobium sp.]|nr:hypothetical protein [Rhizomicrobium sp.]
ESGQITQRILLRNEKVQQLSFSTIDHNSSGHEKLARAQLWFELLDIRRLILEHVDTALVVITESLDELHAYRKNYLPRRTKLAAKFLGPEVWTTYTLPEEWKKYLPDKRAYSRILTL